MRLIWGPEAANDFRRLHAFIFPHNPAAARRAIKRLRKGAKLLELFPYLGGTLKEIITLRHGL